MDTASPFYLYDPESPGWLRRQHAEDGFVGNEDLFRLITANPDSIPDEQLRDYVCRGLLGGLKPKRGPKRSTSRDTKLYLASLLVDELTPRLERRRERQRKKGMLLRGTPSPSERAHEMVARHLKLASGPTLRNEISAWRNSHKLRAGGE